LGFPRLLRTYILPGGYKRRASLKGKKSAMAQKEARVVVVMACTECHGRNYTTSKNRVKQTARLQLKKYCPRPVCRKHTMHREDK
jgi:large subunit ribosomal protein L33